MKDGMITLTCGVCHGTYKEHCSTHTSSHPICRVCDGMEEEDNDDHSNSHMPYGHIDDGSCLGIIIFIGGMFILGLVCTIAEIFYK